MKRLLLYTLIIVAALSLVLAGGFQTAYGSNEKGGKTDKGDKGTKASTVLKVKIAPKHRTLKLGVSKKFTATVKGKGKIDRSVLWSVVGGDENGTIEAINKKKAKYTAPSVMPSSDTVTIRAESVADSTIFGEATITLKSKYPEVTSGDDVANTITIENSSFSPLNIGVAAGTTITVTNKDSVEHSVTSQEDSNEFTPGAVSGISFDTGAFLTPDQTIEIPAEAESGTVIPYYCSVHTESMTTPNGYITVQ